MSQRPGLAPDLLVVARSGYGWLLTAAPQQLIPASSPRATTVARVLGARHLVQALATAGAEAAGLPPVPVLLAGAAVDVTHAASMLGFAMFSRRLRHVALGDAALETALGVFGVVAARSLAQRTASTAITASRPAAA